MNDQILRIEKVIASIPAVLTANTLYFVKKDAGYELFVSDKDGINAFPMDTTSIKDAVTKSINESTIKKFVKNLSGFDISIPTDEHGIALIDKVTINKYDGSEVSVVYKILSDNTIIVQSLINLQNHTITIIGK